MEKVLVLMLMVLSICQVSTASFRVLLEDEVPGNGKVNSPAENPPSKDKFDKLTLSSNTNNSTNQSALAPPDAIEPKRNKTIETTQNPKQENVTVQASPGGQETNNKSTDLGAKEGNAVPDNTGTKADTGTKKDENVGGVNGLCDMAHEKCFDDKYIACLQHPGNGSGELFLVVQNKGENDISLDVRSTPSTVLDSKKLDLAKHDYRKVKIQITDANNAGNITLTSNKNDCILHIEPTTANFDWQKPFQQFASYATQLTPIYAAYLFLSLVAISLIIFGCCKFIRGRRRSGGGSGTYQQLEMGGNEIIDDYRPNSENVDGVNTADGWENGWDDNWDEYDEEAVLGRDAETNNVGLSSRRSSDNNINSKDGWDVDWDD